VVINEINYNPPEGASLEFVELYNPDAAPVPMGGWSFARGIHFIFPEGSFLPPNGYLVLCQNREEVARKFGLPLDALLGNFTGSLDNGGETLTLIDATGAVVDSLQYDDDAPWATGADGAGPSLERICASFDSGHPGNWNAPPGGNPTPLAPNHMTQCPPPSIPAPKIAINEIHYHPVNDADAKEEFVELRNNTAASINLKGYAFSAGIDFQFKDDQILEPGKLLVVARDRDALRAARQIDNVVGNFQGQLSNDGERITLVDPSGNLADSVRYGDSGDWPVAADGLGRSLEKIVPDALSDDPASWKEASFGDPTQWHHVVVSGIATHLNLFLAYLDGEGEFLLDNIAIVDPANPSANFVPNGTFDSGLDPWILKGTHADTTWDTAGGPDGSGALHLVSTGRGTGATNGLSLVLVPDLVRTNGPTYQMSFDYKYVSGSRGLILKLTGSVPTRGLYWQFGAGSIFTPGAPNSVEASRLPPFVTSLGRFPQEPKSADAITISAKVRTEGSVSGVKVLYHVNGAAETLTADMFDDGQHGDVLPGDRAYGGVIPAQPHNTIITFQVRAEDSAGAATLSPPETDPTGVHAFYVNDLQPDSPLPVYTLLVNHTAATQPRSILAGINCTTYRTASFAFRGEVFYNVGLRQRGQSVCGSTKPFLKVRFQRGRDFESQHKIDLQSLWTDKSLLRETMSWDMFRDVGMPYCKESWIRLHVNGKYFGLYGQLEHPDSNFLARNHLNADGNLYKAVASTEERKPSYIGSYEKKTNEDNDFTDITEFLNSMHATPRNQLVTFFSTRVDEVRVIDYQMAQTLTNNSDYPHKNHYLYHDTERGKWMPLTWDMDLTFGKIWDGTYGGVLHDKMHTPGNNPWYTTSVDGGLGNHLLDKFFFQAGDYYRRAYLVRLWDALQEKYTEQFFAEKIGFLHDFLFDEQAQDIAAWGRSPATADDRTAPKEFEPNLQRVKEHIRSRRAYLLNYLTTRSKFTGHDRLKITEVMYNPLGAEEDLEFLELWNPTGKDIDISGWKIEGIDYVFPADSKALSDEVFVVAKNPVAFSARYGPSIRAFGPYEGNLDNDGETLRVKDAGPGYPATVDFLRYGHEDDWPRAADGLGYSLELTAVTPNRDNDLGIYWRASREIGGSPGKIEGVSPGSPLYRRGDPNTDGRINLSDALVILRYLFQGSGDPPCLQAGDVDGNGEVKTEDAIFLLQYLFQNHDLVVPSPGPGECLPAKPESCQRSNCAG
jgi:hypothetical protein